MSTNLIGLVLQQAYQVVEYVVNVIKENSMAYLFVVENKIAKPNDETLLISPFKEIWERDISIDKEVALKELTFIEFMSSKKKTNPYGGYDDEARFEQLRKDIFDETWEMDALVEKGLIKINEFQIEASATFQYYLSALTAAEKMRSFFGTFNINERNERTGNPVYKPSDITRALKDTSGVLTDLSKMKEQVEQDLFEKTKTRGDKVINPFEM